VSLNPADLPDSALYPCATCAGTGRDTSGEDCRDCNGTGLDTHLDH